MTQTLMKCGCVSHAVRKSTNGVEHDPPIPCCPVHNCIEVAETKPSLEGRQAECSYRHSRPAGRGQRPGPSPVPSSYELAFFEYRGPGSRHAEETCRCGLYRETHDKHGGAIPARTYATVPKGCASFQAVGPAQFDRFYCGCFGWD